jgi:3-isopropylmalate dehydrogenase
LTTYRIGLAAGDGIGPEISSATHTVIDAACKDALVSIDWVEAPIGFDAIASYGDPIPAETKSALASCDGFVLGPHDSASYPEEYRERRNPSGELRTYFDLYANIRPARAPCGSRSQPTNGSRHRQGEYGGVLHRPQHVRRNR